MKKIIIGGASIAIVILALQILQTWNRYYFIPISKWPEIKVHITEAGFDVTACISVGLSEKEFAEAIEKLELEQINYDNKHLRTNPECESSWWPNEFNKAPIYIKEEKEKDTYKFASYINGSIYYFHQVY